MKKITIITGHYGSGKTNLAVNLALRLADAGEKVTIVDFDIVNPYFRTADFAELFQKHGVTLAASMYANTSLDIPAISFDMERMAYEPGYLIVDVGGDDAGAIGLGRYAEGFSAYVPDVRDRGGFPHAPHRYCEQFQSGQGDHRRYHSAGAVLRRGNSSTGETTAGVYHLPERS